MKPKVYVVQNQHRWDSAQSKFLPKFDLAPAAEHGELVYLLSPTAAPFNSEPIVDELKAKLVDFGPRDFLLLVGNPVLIGMAVAVAARFNRGNVAVLQWSGKDKRYLPVHVTGLFT